MNKILLFNVGITQHDIRNVEQIPAMIEHVSHGGYFNDETLAAYANEHGIRKAPVIDISKFDDGYLAIHNGHHRAVAIWLGGRDYLREDEYRISKWTHDEYDDIVFNNEDGNWVGWLTPFDVHNEVRIAELADYKQKVQKVFDKHGESAAKDWIRNNKHEYLVKKHIDSVPDMSRELLMNGLGKLLSKKGILIGKNAEEYTQLTGT